MSPRATKAETGLLGENEAALFLQNKGYTILHRNWRNGKDELDIVATFGRFLVFVEVKTRSGTAFGQPWEAVTMRKQNALIRAAEAYIRTFQMDMDARFDIISVLVSPNKDVLIDHIEYAFSA